MTIPVTALQQWGYSSHPGVPVPLAEFLTARMGPVPPRPSRPLAEVTVRPSRLADGAAAEELAAAVEVHYDDELRLRCSGGFSFIDLCHRRWPAEQVPVVDAVVVPADHAQVRAVMDLCGRRDWALVPFGGGTSVVGGIGVDERPTIGMAFWNMSAPVSLDAESGQVVVQPGITGPELERWLQARGFTWGHLPQSWERASVGGYVSTRSSGQASAGYGRSDDTVTRLRVATPVGDLDLGRGPASAAGPDLREVFLGGEGAFGVVTEVGLRVRPLPEAQRYEGWLFPTFEAGQRAFRTLAQQRSTADVMRLSDRDETEVTLTMGGPTGWKADAFDRYTRMRKVERGSLAILGWEGPKDLVRSRRAHAKKVFGRFGGVLLGGSVGRAWLEGRYHGPYLRDDLMDAGYLVETLETANDWSLLAPTREAVRVALQAALGDCVVGCHLSHIYPTGASLYFTVIAPLGTDPVRRWWSAKSAATDAIVASGATITHHHAVGRDHAPWLASEVGEGGVGLLRAIKSHLDPGRVCNPGVLGL